MKPIPYGKQSISEADIQAVIEILTSSHLTQGPLISEFEEKIASYCSARYATAVGNATQALHLGCLALEVGPGDEVWTSPNTFVASANCALYAGARVDFVDIDPLTYNISISALEAKLRKHRAERLAMPKLLIPVHHSGFSCDMKSIRVLANEYGFKIMEDASHAIGGSYGTSKIGSCQYSDLAVFSFHPVKIITTGEGGMLTTQNAELDHKLKRLRSHGITRDPSQMTKSSDGPWYYEQIELGYNYRITDIQCALGLSQMNRIDEFVDRRRALAKQYHQLLSALPLKLPSAATIDQSAWHLYTVRVDTNRVKKNKKQIFEELHQQQIMVNLHYIPVYLQPYYQNLGFKRGLCPEAESYYQEAISLPMYASLADDEQLRVVESLKKVLS